MSTMLGRSIAAIMKPVTERSVLRIVLVEVGD
jgi:hypothetical protein